MFEAIALKKKTKNMKICFSSVYAGSQSLLLSERHCRKSARLLFFANSSVISWTPPQRLHDGTQNTVQHINLPKTD